VILSKVRAVSPRPTPVAVALPPQAPEQAPPPPPSPYAPPAAAMRETGAFEPAGQLYSPAAGAGGEITAKTVEALTRMRPWLRFLVGYGFVVLALMALGAVGMLLGAARSPQMLPFALGYGLYALIGLAFLLPLRRSVEAIRRLAELGPRATIETFIVEQGTFWRRMGVLTAVMVALLAVGFFLAILLGGFATLMKTVGK
jgi:hypothetical protein